MGNFEFDKIIDRHNTGSLKWDKYKDNDIIPMWVADMDFRSPEPIINALKQRAEHGVFGYSISTDELKKVVCDRLQKLYNWKIEPKWIIWLAGLVPALNIASRFPAQDEEIITFIPAYPPFLESPRYAGRKLIKIPLLFKDSKYTFDLDAFEKAITPRTKLFLLCNPHNPVGRMYEKCELEQIAEICLKHDISICSDEIHCELILSDKQHIPTSTLGEKIQDRTITLMSPAKTFNLSGLNCGFAVIPNEKTRKQFLKTKYAIASPGVNAMGLAACKAAYTECEEWKASLLEYLRKNKNILYEFVNAELSPVMMADVEATYLAWLDVRALNSEQPVRFFEDAGVGLYDGAEFGDPGFVRLNFGCPRQTLLKALERMKKQIQNTRLTK